MGGGKICSVVGCRSHTQEREKHFYRFPSNPQLRNVWMQFTRRGDDFTVKYHVICERHFAQQCFLKKKKQLRLKEGSAPTIFERLTKNGKEKVVMDFDPDLVCYMNSENLLDPVYDKEEHGKSLTKEQKNRMKDVRKLCRFCLEDKAQDENLIAVSKLEDYYIKLDEVFSLVGIDRKFDGIFNSEVCEECFQHIITFDGFRKRCRKAHIAVVTDLRELDEKIQQVCNTITEYSEYFVENETVGTKKEQPVTTWADNDKHFQQDDSNEHQNQISSQIKTDNVMVSPLNFQKIKEEAKDEPISDGEEELSSFQFPAINMDDSDDEPLVKRKAPNEDEIEMPNEAIQVREESDDDFDWKVPDVTLDEKLEENKKQKPLFTSRFSLLVDDKSVVDTCDKQYFANRIYECWFCRMKFAGKKTFKRHDCPNKEMKCPIEKCEKCFRTMSGYNQHIVHLHKLPKLCRIYCKICKLSMVGTEQEFKSHLRKCEINSNNLASNHSIKCEVCLKIIPNMQSYSIHLLFHKPDAPKRNHSNRKDKKGKFICETCGRDFEYQRYLRHHIKRLHSEPEENPLIYTCDHCGKTRTNRVHLSKHIRNVHRSDPSPCGICGKVFRNKALMQAHMIYHKDSKRIHFCPLCPDKPPYVTAVALRRHQESNHGFGPGYQCEICNGTYRTKASLKQHTSTVHKNPVAQSFW